MFYTAISRKEEKIIVISQKETIKKMCNNPQPKRSCEIGKFMRKLLEERNIIQFIKMNREYSSNTLIKLEQDEILLQKQQDDIKKFREYKSMNPTPITQFNIPKPIITSSSTSSSSTTSETTKASTASKITSALNRRLRSTNNIGSE